MPENESPLLRGRVAVITGAASGIGLALAVEAAHRGMDVALADISADALAAARAQVEAEGVRAITAVVDVRSLADVETLRAVVERELGTPWLIANNAGVAKVALAWDMDDAAWRRILDINVGGVVNGLLAFLPGLRERRSGHILNTASVGGLLSMPANAAYVASKHAVIGLSETLYRELEADGSDVGISVLCPALVKTGIAGTRVVDGKQVSAIESDHAMEPADVARITFDAIEAKQFWILTHVDGIAPYMGARLDDMLAQRNPGKASVDPGILTMARETTGLSFD